MLLKLEDISLEFGEKILFSKLNFIFNEDDRIGIIGDNGVGKSSLFNIILNKLEHSGNVLFENKNFGYLSQDEGFVELKLTNIRKEEIEQLLLNGSIINDTDKYNQLLEEYNELISNSNGQRELNLIKKFNFNQKLYQKEKKENLSGGESTKLKLIKLFAQDYKYYLLDEPSNHLDLNSKEQLITELHSKPSYIIISHDIELLNKCCNKIAEIRNNSIKVYSGNYEKYLEFKKKEEEDILKIRTEHSREKKRIKRNIENLKSWGASKMKEKTKHLKKSQVIRDLGIGKGSVESGIADTSRKINKFKDKLNNLESPELENNDEIKIKYLNLRKPNQIVLKLKGLKKKFENFQLNIKKFEIDSKEKVVIQGDKGSGKSTLLKLILKEIEKDEGSIHIGENIDIGYLSQKNETLNHKNTVLRELTNTNNNLEESEIRKYLGKFLFKKNDVFKVIKDLSGGEKIRLGILKLILEGSNFLILDEPSNHLDIRSKDILASALKDFPGPILVVSHDNYFLDQFVNRKITISNGTFS